MTVLVGKILEQTDLELREEEEIKNVRQNKKNLLARVAEEKLRIKQIEGEEIKRRSNHVEKELHKFGDNKVKKTTQQLLISRVFAKAYLKRAVPSSVQGISDIGLFSDTEPVVMFDFTNEFVFIQSEQLTRNNNVIDDIIKGVITDNHVTMLNGHSTVITQRRERLQREQEEAEELARVKIAIIIFV